MKKNTYLIIVLLGVVVTGCKTEVLLDTSFSNLTDQPLHTERANLELQVASCVDYEDSRNPSENLLQVQEAIPNVFHGAKYKTCYTKQMESFASFEIPIGVGNIDSELLLTNDLNIVSDPQNRLIYAHASEGLFRRFHDYLQSNLVSDLNLKVKVNIENDVQDEINYTGFATFVGDYPCVQCTFKSDIKQVASFVLSDVSVEFIMGQNRSGDKIFFARY